MCRLAAFAAFLVISTAAAAPVKTHPRLLFRADQLDGIRSRMNPGNDVWLHFKSQIVDKALLAWKCSSTSQNVNGDWVRTSFTDENGVVHQPDDADWDSGKWSSQSERPAVPEDDVGQGTGIVRLASEQYAMLFALMARLYDDGAHPTEHAEFLAAAKQCLFKVIDEASKGSDPTNTQPWRQSYFAQADRSFYNESFALAVDWIYEDLDPAQLAKVRKAFLIWSEQANDHTYFAPKRVNGQHGPANSPALLRLNEPDQAVRRDEIRLALNNHWANHLRQMVLYGLALDPDDDVPNAALGDNAPAGAVTSQIVSADGSWVPLDTGVLRDATGVWLYLTDYAYRHDGAGGPSLEGTEYATNGLGPVALALAAMQTAGQDDPQVWGPQVKLAGHPFWTRQIAAYLCLLPPASRVPSQLSYLGPIFQPPLYGDLETFAFMSDQFIKELGPLGIADAQANGPTGPVAQAVRYIQRNLAPGGAAQLQKRIQDTVSGKALRDAIYYFLVFDPAAPAPSDPRNDIFQPLTFYASHVVNGREMGLVLARTGRTANDTYFHFRNDWNRINHQRGDSLSFGLWKNGLWLTKVMTGYGEYQGLSEYRNSLALQNGDIPDESKKNPPPGTENPRPDINLYSVSPSGGQWYYGNAGDPAITTRSFGQGFVYLTADGTNLYNHYNLPGINQIQHASRSIAWLKPDHVVVYDRVKSTAGFFKRFYLNLPDPNASVAGKTVHATAREGATAKAELFVTSLLPPDATPQIVPIPPDLPANGIGEEDMKCRMLTEAPGAAPEARFLHVVQGTDAGVATPDATQLVTSDDGAFEGAIVGNVCVVFRQDLANATPGLGLPSVGAVMRFYLTGLQPSAGYDVTFANGKLTVAPGTQRYSDGGGVLVWEPGGGAGEPASVAVTATDAQGSESGGGVTFTFTRSGDVSQALVLPLAYSGTAGLADVTPTPVSLTIPAGQPSAALTLVPVNDSEYEGEETLSVSVTVGAGYHVSEATALASATIADNDAPPGGTLQFTAPTFLGPEGGTAVVTLSRFGGTSGGVSVRVTAIPGTAAKGSDFADTSTIVSWGPGDGDTKTVPIPLPEDVSYEGDETFTVSLSQVTGAAAIGDPASATVTIDENDPAPPGQLTLSPAMATVVEGTTNVVFTVIRSGGDGGAASVNYATANGSAVEPGDYTAKSGSLAWDDGEAGAQTITIPIKDDTLYEGDSEVFTLALSGATGAPVAGATSATVTITEDDPPPAAYHVGEQPGDYATLADVPWPKVGAGSTVYLRYRPAAYKGKIILTNAGTAAQPIRLVGVKGPNGERPIIDGDGAKAPANVLYPAYSSIDDDSLISITRREGSASNFKPAYIEIAGLEIRNAHPDYPFVKQSDGATKAYSDNAAGIYVGGADHVTIRDCAIHHCAQGVVTSQGGGSEEGLVRDLLIEACDFHDNGKAGKSWGRNIGTQGIGVTLRHNRLGPTLSGNGVENVRDRSAGFLAIGNWVDGGGSQFRIEEPSAGLITADPAFGTVRMAGNILRSFESGSVNVITVAPSVVPAPRNVQLIANTVHAEGGYSRTFVKVESAGDTVAAYNNVLRATGISELRLADGAGQGGVTFGRTHASPAYVGNAAITIADTITTGAASPFTDEAAGDYHAPIGSPLIDASGPLPAGIAPPGSQFVAPAGGVLRPLAGAAPDLGAFEAGADESAYAVWAYSYFGEDPIAGAPDADPDTDGATNLAEFQAGTNPTFNENAPPATPTPPPATPMPTPRPPATAPKVKILGKKKVLTTKPTAKVRGVATGVVKAVLFRVGKGRWKPVRLGASPIAGVARWRVTVRLKLGRNKVQAIARGPGGISPPARIKILRK